MTDSSQFPVFNPNGERIDPETGLPLPDPFPDYVVCPHCGEEEVEVWCFKSGGVCHQCGGWVAYPKPKFCGLEPYCNRTAGREEDDPSASALSSQALED